MKFSFVFADFLLSDLINYCMLKTEGGAFASPCTLLLVPLFTCNLNVTTPNFSATQCTMNYQITLNISLGHSISILSMIST